MMQPKDKQVYEMYANALTTLEAKHHGQAWFTVTTGVDLGFLPGFLLDSDPRPVREQLDERYAHGGGWRPIHGFTITSKGQLLYPGDPPLRILAISRLRDEILAFYDASCLLVIQPTGEWEVVRVD